MFRKLLNRLRRFFLPPAETPLGIRLLPYGVLGLLTVAGLVSGVYAWDYTNSPQFCGTACHTMPPEYTAYLVSPHARIDCVECHIGRGFVATRVTRKAGDLEHVFRQAFKQYEFPIHAEKLRPARETCERCHFPEKFSDDSLREIKRYLPDAENTPISIYLNMKTGGGSARQGLGRGIHWHVENEVLYFALDPTEQQIPLVRVVDPNGLVTEYVDVESGLVPESVDSIFLKRMDCITCHNRITHLIPPPVDTIDELMARGLVSPAIPEIRLKAVEVFHLNYETIEQAVAGIAELESYYETSHPEFYNADRPLLMRAIAALQEAYRSSVFPEQQANWTSHPNNVGHRDAPGCFRCHDGKHLDQNQQAIRLECNLCHSIPVVAGPSDPLAQIEIARGPVPSSHRNTNWIGLHKELFDPSCSGCHTTDDPGGTSDTSFCSNSACHGIAWVYAGLDAPSLREILLELLPQVQPEPAPLAAGPLTYEAQIGPLLSSVCGTCHGETQGLDLTSYESALQGGLSGPAIVPGDPDASLLVQKQSAATPHFGQLSAEQLSLVVEWIGAGAPRQ
jgi:nitrate/TMAO reductase-like tetraheme cytochrome c subunit/mono/diheme cytochrome c family protein